MHFEKHVFISYAHIDNQTADEGEEGWITQFHRYLENFLGQNLGDKARIWRDERLRGIDIFANEIVSQFAKTAALLSILTPRYLKSEWCTREVDEFCKIAEQTGGLIVDNKTRVIKVVRLPVSIEAQPAVMQDALGYEFFTRDGEHTLPLDPNFGKEYAEAYRRKIYILAQDIAELLEELVDQADPDREADRAKPIVYLAECSYDQREEREKIRGELQAHGHTILPDRRLPESEGEYIATVQELMRRCDLAIHVVGVGYGSVPDGPSLKSNVMLQNEIAIHESESRGLKRVIWLPEGTRSDQAQQQDFIDALHHEDELQTGAELITGDLEALKGVVHSTLVAIEQAMGQPESDAAASDETGTRMIYLLCDKRDRTATIPLLKYLREQGFEVKLPTFAGDAAEVREANEAVLKACDAVLLFWGAGDEAWKSHQENELRKTRGVRQKPMLSFMYLAKPESGDKEFVVLAEEPNVIDGQKGFSEAALQPFVEALNA